MKVWLWLALLSAAAAAERKVRFQVYPPDARVSLVVGARQPHWPLEAGGVVPEQFFGQGRGDLEFWIDDPRGRHQGVTVQVHKHAIRPGETYLHPTPISLRPLGLAVLTDWFLYPTWASYGVLLGAVLGVLAYRSRRSLSQIDREARRRRREIHEVEQATGVRLPPGKTHFDRIGNFFVVQAIGQGGFGTVWLGCRADRRSRDGLVAIKRPIPPALNPQDPKVKSLRDEAQRLQYLTEIQHETEQRFMRECKRHQELDHPHIVQLIDYNKDAEGLYLVMEYLPGRNFQSYLSEKGPLSIAESLSFFAQICAGLHAIHSRGITHRDVKPDNMILSQGKLKITDFGTARKRTLDSAYQTVVDADGPKVAGTLLYMAPEVMKAFITQSSETDLLSSPAIDQYAAGVTLYQMLSGAWPVTGSDVYFPDLPITPIAVHRADLPPSLVDCLEIMLSKDPESRFPSLQHALEAALSST